jgi:hypothetical protein
VGWTNGRPGCSDPFCGVVTRPPAGPVGCAVAKEREGALPPIGCAVDGREKATARETEPVPPPVECGICSDLIPSRFGGGPPMLGVAETYVCIRPEKLAAPGPVTTRVPMRSEKTTSWLQ